MRASARLPLHSYFTGVLEYFEIAPLQLAHNGYGILTALFIIYHQMGFPQPTPREVNYMDTIKRIPSGGAGFYYFSAWSSEKLNLSRSEKAKLDEKVTKLEGKITELELEVASLTNQLETESQ